MGEWLSSAWDSVTNFLGDTITSGVEAVLYNTVYKLLYYIASALCWILGVVYDMFEVFAGLTQVSYDGEKSYLIDVFFNNASISNVYWAMALIGIALCFGFTIITVARKAADMGERIRSSFGAILSQTFRSIVLILAMSAIITMVLNATNILMQRVNYVFSNAETLTDQESIDFDDEEYAAMARVLNTIGNYSLNPSYNSHYNLHSCFNEVRADMQYLQERGVFDFYYVTKDDTGQDVVTWQSALQQLANAGDLSQDLSMDYYNSAVSNALLNIMDILRTNNSFRPLSHYNRQYVTNGETVPLEVLVYLMGTTQAAKNSAYNIAPAMNDPVRGPYYTGQKSIHDFDAISADFDIGMATNYILIFILAYFLIKNLLVIIFNCVARIFNMLMLYLIFPPIAAAAPADGGGKVKQWTTAFIVQSLSVFGTVIAMRLLMLYIPVIVDARLQLFDSPVLNLLGKVILVVGGVECVKRASGIVTGILADNAGMQALQAGDMRGYAARQFGRATAGARAIAGAGMAAAAGLGRAGMSAMSSKGGPETGMGNAAPQNKENSTGSMMPRGLRNFGHQLSSGFAAAKSILTGDENADAYARDLNRLFGGGSAYGGDPGAADVSGGEAVNLHGGAQASGEADAPEDEPQTRPRSNAVYQRGASGEDAPQTRPRSNAIYPKGTPGDGDEPETRPRSKAVHYKRPPSHDDFMNSLR